VQRLVVIGNFDGVHRGHAALLADAVREARERGLCPTVLTFEPHPASVLGRTPPPLLTRLARKRALLRALAPELEVAVRTFDRAFSERSPESFARDVLAVELEAAKVLVGFNFRFGRGRAGGHDELVALGRELGFEVARHPLVGDDQGAFSSTRARRALGEAALDEVRGVLGRPHALLGVVEHGDKRGRTLGFPTANLGAVEEALPPHGVYAVRVARVTQPEPLAWSALAGGVMNVGVRPTVSGAAGAPRVEVHLFDRDDDLYGATLLVELVSFLRPEQRFAGLDELRSQIALDAAGAREALAREAPAPAE
jgi:riboflavin kinase/FMN adenylyltransferase